MHLQHIATARRRALWPAWIVILALYALFLVYTGHRTKLLSIGVLALAFAILGHELTYRMRWVISLAVLGLALLLLLYQLGGGSLHDWDEAIYAQVTREMLQSDLWGTLRWNGSLFFHKPPLYFWLTALTYQLLGVNEFAARLWSALFGFGVIVLTFVLGVRIHSWAVGVGAALLLLGVNHGAYSHDFNFLSQARVGMLDVPLTFWIVGAVVLIWEAEERPWLITVIGLVAGLAFMTKAWPGGLALVLPFVYWLCTRHGRPQHLGYWLMAGGLAGLVALPWHLWEFTVYGNLFLENYFGLNLVGRLFRHIEQDPLPPYFYLDKVRRGFSLWGYLWPFAYLWGVWQACKYSNRPLWLLLIWITLPLVLFSLAQTKQGWYISMVYPGIALLLGLVLVDRLTDQVALAVVAVVMGLCCIRLPVGVDGAPGVKPFAPHVAQYVAPNAPLYVFERSCTPRGLSLPPGTLLQPGENVQPSLRFYLDRPLICLEPRDLAEGAHVPHAYIISQRKWLPHVNALGPIVFAGETYILIQWQ